MQRCLAVLLSAMLFPVLLAPGRAVSGAESEPESESEVARTAIEPIVLEAFHAAHDGYSVDETLIQSDLRTAFESSAIQGVCEQNLPLPRADRQMRRLLASTLLKLRKTGEIGKVTTRRAPAPEPDAPNKDAYRFAVEIAARQIQSKHRAHTDDILIDPALRDQFLRIAHSVSDELPGLTDAMLLRDALRLRKARKLRPELVARIADWGRTVRVYDLSTLLKTLLDQKANENNGKPPRPQDDAADRPRDSAGDVAGDIPGGIPGVYIFRDKTGYLYIGEAKDLRRRLKQHLRGSQDTALAVYIAERGDVESIQVEIHAFDPDSDARRVAYRRAYESDLIATRRPRFNLRP